MFLFSIIVPVYNAESYLERCIDSLHLEKYNDVQLILIDDGSKDHSGDICQYYTALYPNQIIYISKKNAGVSAARNDGLEVAEGKFILFYDSDDYVLENYMDELIRITKFKADLYVYNYQILDRYKNIQHQSDLRTGYVTFKNFTNEDIFSYLGYQVWNKVFLRSIINAYNLSFDTTMKWSEDLDFWVRYVFHTNAIYLVNIPLYIYRENEKGAVASSDKRSLENIQTAFHHQLDLLDDQNADQKSYHYLSQKYVEHLSLNVLRCYQRYEKLSELKNEIKRLHISNDLRYKPLSISARYKMICLKHCWLLLLIWYFKMRKI